MPNWVVETGPSAKAAGAIEITEPATARADREAMSARRME
jgi:hypothetical protein